MKFQSYSTNCAQTYFGELPMTEQDEHLHELYLDADFSWAETQMFGFSIPEHSIDCMIWFIYRPRLKATYGGITIWQGIKAHHLESEVFDLRVGLPLPNDITNWACPNGVTIRMLEACQAFHITYSSRDGSANVDLILRGIMPAAVRYNGNHITQAMRTSGSLRLGNVSYEIDGYYSRDRSWGENRDESPQALPPLSWIAGVFNQDFAFHLTAFESPELRPEWNGLYPMPEVGQNVLWGYIWDRGRLSGIADAQMMVHRPNGIAPSGVGLVLKTESGESYEIEGWTRALNPAIGWPNISTNYALTQWSCRGQTGWGDNQDVMFGAHRRYLARQRAPAVK